MGSNIRKKRTRDPLEIQMWIRQTTSFVTSTEEKLTKVNENFGVYNCEKGVSSRFVTS